MSTNNSTARILVIDDNLAAQLHFRNALNPESSSGASAAPRRQTFALDFAVTAQEAVEMLQRALVERNPYALAFVDLQASVSDATQTVGELAKLDTDLQIIICTECSAEQVSPELDANDRIMVLRKPVDSAELQRLTMTVADKWAVNRQRNELEKMVQERTAELKRAALHDMLTGLPNRLLFNDRLENAMRRGKRDSAYRFAVLFVDCDRFKVINDSLGHRAGDMLLLQIAERLKGAVRDVDTVTRPLGEPVAARLGGDEFAIMLDRINGDADAARVASRLLAELSRPYHLDGREVHSSVSIGITTNSVSYESAEDMVRDADTAMHLAKSGGGNAFILFDAKMHEEAVIRLTLESDLRRAIERGQLAVHYQPIIAMRTRHLMGFEALARWNHPVLGAIAPEKFIPIAEETGTIIPLGVWVLEQACAQLASWQRAHPTLSHLTMSVNVSRRQLAWPELIGEIQRILRQTFIDPRNLKLEITESAVMDDPETAIRVLTQIQQVGVKLHMDDFGSGFSSLSCLRNFPLDGLKIDREFVDGVSTGHNQAAIVKSVVSLAHNLKVPLVAEGIETPEQIAALEAMGCDQAQGYLFAKPMDPQAASDFIAKQASAINAA